MISLADADHGSIGESGYVISDRLDAIDALSKTSTKGVLDSLLNIQQNVYTEDYMNSMHRAYHPAVSAPPVNLEVINSRHFSNEKRLELFDPFLCQALSPIPALTQYELRTKYHVCLLYTSRCV